MNSQKSIRFDFGGIAAKQRQLLPDGRVICEGTFARDGILVYRQPNGSMIRELRLPETNRAKDTLTTYGASPITNNHPPEMVNSRNAKRLAVGFSDRQTVYDNGFLRGIVMLHDQDAIDRVDSGKVQLSPGYICDVEHSPGEWRGQRYDRIQRNVRTNHIAIVDIGRNGPDVRLHWDSADQDIAALVQEVEEAEQALYFDFGRRNDESNGGFSMSGATRTIQIGTYKWDGVPGDLADQVHSLTQNAANMEAKLDAATEGADELQQKLDEAEEKLDAQNEILREQHQKLIKAGFVLDDDGVYQRQDMNMKDKQHPPKEQPDGQAATPTVAHNAPAPAATPVAPSGDEAAGEEQQEGEPPEGMKHPKKKMDSIEDLLETWIAADTISPGIKSEKFDSGLSVIEIQRLTIDSIRPGMDYSDNQIPGIFYALSQGLMGGGTAPRKDAAGMYADRLDTAIHRANTNASRAEERIDEDEGVNENYTSKLALSLD